MRLVALLSLLVACTDAKTVVDDEVTALEVTVDLDAQLGIDRLRVSSTHAGAPAFAPGSLPEVARPVASGETFVVLVPDDLDGEEVQLRIDGESGDAVVATGIGSIVVRAHQLTRLEIELGEPAICGDGAIRDGIETCDDANAAASDGCSDACTVETGWICTNAPSSCVLDTFDVVSATALGNRGVMVTFNGPPNAAQAMNLASYSIPGLSLTGTPIMQGNSISLQTTSQQSIDYTVMVTGVTRASDGKALAASAAAFTGVPLTAPTVTGVTVLSTLPDNQLVPYTTGTTTVRITGTQLFTVDCPTGVRLDDVDGGGAAVATRAASCTVDGDGQITATFPAGIRTNGATGWNVIVTNDVGTNATSSERFVPIAGLLISEVYIGSTGVPTNANHEYVEVYNPTSTALDATALGLQLHLRDAVGNDTSALIGYVGAPVIPAHGFFLFVSDQSDSGDAWFAKRDATFTAGLVGNGGVYLSTSTSAQTRVLDKVGWGLQAIGGVETTALANASLGKSCERKPGTGAGHATDTDNNSLDFAMFSTTLSPRGTQDTPQP